MVYNIGQAHTLKEALLKTPQEQALELAKKELERAPQKRSHGGATIETPPYPVHSHPYSKETYPQLTPEQWEEWDHMT